VPRVNVAVAYQSLGEWEKAAEELRAAIGLAPDEPMPYGNLSGTYIELRKFDEARKVLDDALARGLDSTSIRTQLYVVAFFRHDAAEMTRQLEAARRFPDGFRILPNQASFALLQGQLMLAKELTAQYASEAMSKTGLKGSAAGGWSALAQMAAVFGDNASARASVRTALDIDRSVSTLLVSAIALASAGDLAQARSLVEDVARAPEAANADVKRGLAVANGILKWRSGGGIDAVPPPQSDTDMTGIFVAGVCNLDAGSPDVAARRFKQILDWKTPSTSALYALAPLYYGRALAKLGKIDEGRAAYDRFFENFKIADAGLPVVTAARREYAKLKPAS
jgi:tetratricopeptide (TPR) repeat protein